MSLIDDDPGTGNTPEFSVSEISGAVKRMIEGEFGHVRVRGELGRISRPRSGHIYLDLKDDRAVLAGVVWKGQAGRLEIEPREGDEVIATGRLTTFPGQSKYQLIIESLAYAGEGALLAKLERLKKALAAEGLFAPERKRPVPFLPATIGVVTSPSGAVIRDILHRLADRFPVRVLVWPVAVQGAACAGEVAAAIRGFGALTLDGPVPRPEVLIVARGGGSVEDLWGFNEEVVVRAAAESRIPLISAVGHETDTTLIDFAADRRAPTPTAAAEMAVPVRSELAATLADFEARKVRALKRGLEVRAQRLGDLSRGLPRPAEIIETRQQRLDVLMARMPRLGDVLAMRRDRLALVGNRLAPALSALVGRHRVALGQRAARLAPGLLRTRIGNLAERLEDRSARLAPAATRLRQRAADRLAGLARVLGSLGYQATLARGYAVVRGDGAVLTRAKGIAPGAALEIEFTDGRVETTAGNAPAPAKPKPIRAKPKPKSEPDDPQGSLF